MQRLVVWAVLALLELLTTASAQDNPACGTDKCEIPDCYCPTSSIPNDLDIDNIPQMVLFSFNGPIMYKEGDIIRGLFSRKRKNPNGTPLRATLFVSDDKETTDYCTVNKLWAAGNEVGSFSVNRKTPPSWWATATVNQWAKEIDNEKEYINTNASVPLSDIVGFRSPHLQTGGDAQYKFAEEQQYLYDSSMVLPLLTPRVWPYTMDYPTNYTCHTPPCPKGSYPGFWQIPVQPLVDKKGKPCIYLDKCANKPRNADDVFNILMSNFNASFTSNRAPLMINLLDYEEWFKQNPWALGGIDRFINEVLLLGEDDVWFVTYKDLIGWMKTPTILSNIRYFAPFTRTKQLESDCVENRRQGLLGGRWLLLAEVILCVGGYLYIYIKERHENSK